MEHTHEYDCIVCGAHFDSSKDLSRHNEQQHLKGAAGMERPRDPTKPVGDEETGRRREP